MKIVASLLSCLKVLFFISFFFSKTSLTKMIFVKFKNLSIQKLSSIQLLCKLLTENSCMRLIISVVQDSKEKELSSFVVQALQPAVCLRCFQEFFVFWWLSSYNDSWYRKLVTIKNFKADISSIKPLSEWMVKG